MPLMKRSVWILILALGLVPPAHPQEAKPDSEVLAKIKALPGVIEAKEARFDPGVFREAYEVLIEQPLDHRNPDGPKFAQRFFISHADWTKPVLLETEGYAAGRPRESELVRILRGNQVVVEHRFFGKSVPSPLKWEHLTIRQAADDLHRIVAALKTLYPGKWVSSGTSKGGQTTLFYKFFHPGDVDASVPYVAPINIAQEDPRLYRFLRNAGDEAVRKRMTDYQIALFRREDEIMPLVRELAERRKWTFSIGLSEAYEYGVLEYPFAFWQYGTVKPSDIPAPDAPAETLFGHLEKTNAIYYYSDQGRKAFEPFMYQAFTEIGYYNYDITGFKGHMKTLKNPTNLVLCPPGVSIAYNPVPMQDVHRFLQYGANNVIYIYGELDPWSATQIELIGRTDAVKIVVRNGYHGSRIKDFSPEQKDLFYSSLEKWLGVELERR